MSSERSMAPGSPLADPRGTSLPDSTDSPTGGGRARLSHIGALQQRYPLVQLLALCVVFGIGCATLQGFADYTSIKTMLIIASFLGIAAVGQQVVVLLGGIDLTVPSFIVLGNFMVAQLVGVDHWALGSALALQFVIACVVGGTCGFICSHFRVEPLVVTFGAGSMVIGGVAVWTKGLVDASVPSWISRLTSPVSNTLGIDIPPAIVIWGVIAVLIALLLHRTVVGRRIYAAGSNPAAATAALLPVEAIWVFAFALSAVAASLAGLLLAGFSGTGNIGLGDPYLFSSLASVIVGGTSLVGARGDYWRTVLGALLLTVLTTILIGYGLGAAGQQIFYGAVILVVVPAYGRDRRTADRV